VRSVVLAPGRYSVGEGTFLGLKSVEGAGEGVTILEGPVEGLGSGARLSRLTVCGGAVGIRLDGPASPCIEQVTVEGAEGAGIDCSGGAAPVILRSTLQGNGGPGLRSSGPGGPSLIDCVIRGNRGRGVVAEGEAARAVLRRSTVAGNSGEVLVGAGALVTLTSCIVWDNSSEALVARDGGQILATYSCTEGRLWAGTGNLNVDPRFCGWTRGQIFIDGDARPGGNGSAARPFATLDAALDPGDFSVALTAGSPCIGTGVNGENMGADLAPCGGPGNPRRIVHLAAGRHSGPSVPLTFGVSLRGAGRDATSIEVSLPILGLRTGSTLEDLAVVAGGEAEPGLDGVVIGPGEAPRMRRCRVQGMDGAGIRCEPGSRPSIEACWIESCQVGIACDRASPTIVSSVLTDNRGRGLWADAGHVYAGATPTLLHSTIAGSQEPVAALSRALCTLRHCLLVGRPVTGDPAGTADVLATRSLIWLPDPAELWPGEGNLNADPLFAGPNDFCLLPGSPAIDAAPLDPAVLVDIDGRPRPCAAGTLVDLGAYEMGCEPPPPPAPRFVRGDCNADGSPADLADATFLLAFSFLGGRAPICAAACDLNSDGELAGVADAVFGLSWRFLGGPAPPAPFPACGVDPAPGGALGCAIPPVCSG
jgi:hypothetical protein